MFCDFPKYKHLKQTIYRGPGGGGNADSDAEVNQLAAFALEAENSAAAAAASAAAAAGSEADAIAAAASAAAALVSQNAAAASAAAALVSKNAAETAKTAAELAETNAETAQTAAQLAETNAETAETNAELAETNAAASAVSAASSASTATTQAGLASTSASNAATSASNAATSASGASTSASNAASSASSAAASYDSFDDRYLGAKSADPTLDNDGNALLTGALYWNTVASEMRAYSGSAWIASYIPASGYVQKTGDTMSGSLSVTGTVTATTFSGAGTSLTGTASALSIGGNAATATNVPYTGLTGTVPTWNQNTTGNAATATTATNQSGGTVSPTFITYLDNSVQNTAPKVGMVNRIINGAMVIDQRNAGGSVSITASNSFITDRFNFTVIAGSPVMTGQQVADAPANYKYSFKATTTTAASSLTGTNRALIQQNIEGQNVIDLGWGTATASAVILSFWVKSSLTGTFGGALQNSDSSRSYPFTYSIGSAGTWTQISVTIAGDTSGTWLTTNGIGIQVIFGLGVASGLSGTAGAWAGADYRSATGAVSVLSTLNATWQVTGVQLEKGSTATSFDYRPYGTELGLCQRYYVKYSSSGVVNQAFLIGAVGGATVANICSTNFANPMRAVPTGSYSGGTTLRIFDGSGAPVVTSLVDQTSSITTGALRFDGSGGGLTVGRPALIIPNGVSCYVDFSAEL